jgi:hypothetical protein
MSTRILTAQEYGTVYYIWPKILDASAIDPGGLVKYISGVGCVFAFAKTDGNILLIEVSEIWPTCTTQEIPAPATMLEQLKKDFASEFAGLVPDYTKTLLLLVVIGVIIIGVVFLKRS